MINLNNKVSKELTELIKSQLNIKNVELKVDKENKEISVELNTQMTPSLEAEGYAREISRKVQAARKTAGFVCPEPQIHCKMDVIKDISGEGDLKVTLQFKGIDLKSHTFTKSKRDYGNNSSVYYAPLKHKGKDAYLFLSTIGDIVESEIVHQRKGVNRLFDNEVYIPELAEIYDPFSMKVMLADNFITLRYKRNKLN